MHAKTKFGPCLVGNALFFTGHNNVNIWEALYTGEGDDPWDVRGRIGDVDNRHRSKTACEPSAIKYIRTAGTDEVNRYHLVHVGMSFDNDRIIDNKIWYRTRELDWDYWGPQTPITEAYSTHAPSIAQVRTHFRRANRWRIMVAYRRLDNKITLETYTKDFWEHTDWYTNHLPDEIRTSIGPALVNQSPGGGAEPELLYRGAHSDNAIYYAHAERGADLPELQWRWNIERIPNAYTCHTPAVAKTSPGRLVVAFTGHNNNYIWVRVREGESWRNLGYIRGIATEERPAISIEDDTLFLAFKPVNDNEICIGTLEIDEDVGPGAPGHNWVSIRGDRPELNCGST